MKRTRWFNVWKMPPVNGDDLALYEMRCPNYFPGVHMMTKIKLRRTACAKCQWRGLAEKPK